MGRRARHRHSLLKIDEQEFDTWDSKLGTHVGKHTEKVHHAVCGYSIRESWMGSGLQNGNSFTEERQKVTCPKCSAKLGKAALKGKNLSLEHHPEMKGDFRYRGGWKAIVDGQHVAYVGFEDHHWRVYKLGLTPEGELAVSWPQGEDGDGSRSYRFGAGLSNCFSFASKEEALLKAGELRAQGTLKTKEELVANREAYARELEVRNARRDAQQAEKQRERDDTLSGLQSILDRTETGLTNFEREAVANALRMIKSKT